jgi:endonuclease VIII
LPEGPSIVILKEETGIFKGRKVLASAGNSKIDIQRLKNKTVTDFKSWGKHFLICFKGFYLRIHLLMFGSYRINETRTFPPRLHLKFKNGQLNFYSCSVKMIEGTPEQDYDWETDTMSDAWSPKKALKSIKQKPDKMLCDILLDQTIFSGSGNIIKNEVLFRIRVHPESVVKAMNDKQLRELIKTTREYCFDFYTWKKAYVLRKNWLIYRQKTCPRCGIPVVRKHTGETHRGSFFCSQCQNLFVS